MKKLWLAFPLVLAASLYAQQAEAPATAEPVQPVSPTNTLQLVDTLGYTYTKDGVLYASPMALFEIQGVDTQSGLDKIFVSLDDTGYAPYKGPISFAEEGPHTLVYKFLDKVGNISYSQMFNVYIDASAPRVLEPVFSPKLYKASGRNYVGLSNSISFTYYDDIVGTSFVEYTADSNEMVRYSNAFTPVQLGLSTNTPFVLNYRAADAVSNLTPLKNASLYLDAQAPVVNIFANVFELDGIRYISPKEVIQVEAFDADTEVQQILCAINDGPFAPYDAAIGIRIVQKGEYDVKAKAVDIVGNISEEIIYSVVVDATPPAGDAAYAGTLTLVQTNAPAEAAPVAEPVPAAPAAAPAANPAVAPVSQEVPAGTTAPATTNP